VYFVVHRKKEHQVTFKYVGVFCSTPKQRAPSDIQICWCIFVYAIFIPRFCELNV